MFQLFRYWIYQARWYGSILVLAFLAITIFQYSSWLDRSLFGSSQQQSSASQSSVPAKSGQASVPAFPTTGQGGKTTVVPFDVSAQLAQAKSLLSDAASDLSKAAEAVQVWQSKVEAMQGEILPVAAEEANKKYSTAELLDHLAYVMKRERMSPAEIDEVNSQVVNLERKVDDLLNQSSPAALSAVEVVEISNLHDQCRTAKDAWERDVRQALAIKHLLNRQRDTKDPATPTSIASKLSDADAQSSLEVLGNERKTEQEDAKQRKAIKAKRIEKQDQREQEEADLLAQANSPEVQALLAPFLEHRNVQPVMSGQTIKFRTTSEKQPMSWAALQGINALGDSDESLKRLAMLGAHRKLSGPTWSVRSQPHNWSADDRAMLEQARQTLLDYGPVLVSDGQLAP